MEEVWRRGESQVAGRIERKSKERDTLIEGAIMGLARNLAVEKFTGIHKDDSS